MRLMKTGKKKEFRYGPPKERYEEWIALHKRTGIPQQQILHRLVHLVLDQPPELQNILLGTMPVTDDLIELVMRSLKKDSSRRQQVSRLPPDDSTTATGEGEPGNNPKPTPRGGFDPAAEVKPHWGRKKKG